MRCGACGPRFAAVRALLTHRRPFDMCDTVYIGWLSLMVELTFASYAEAMVSGMMVPDDVALVHGAEASPYQVLRAVTPIAQLRAQGTFFTSSLMAQTLWGDLFAQLDDGAVVVDPTCGAGDLLMPVAALNASVPSKKLTFRVSDLDSTFAALATARLQSSLGSATSSVVESHVQDFTTDQTLVSDASVVVLNPPYINMQVNEPWAKGRVNAAAWFTLKAMKAMPAGSRLLAVLPDVLRSGSRYERWRTEISALGEIRDVRMLGQFDDQTDVDVFRLEILVGSSSGGQPWTAPSRAESTVATYFDIRVGPVVPHRDPLSGPTMDFVTARSIASGERLRRAFAGRSESGPMVLIGRTSRPGQNPRVRATLWQSSEPVAVENHLLVAKPKDGNVATCRELIEVLHSGTAVDFLDNRIRCRHLTVRAVKEIPWSENPKS